MVSRISFISLISSSVKSASPSQSPEALSRILKVVPEDFFLANVAVSAIAVKWKECIAWYPITFRPRQGGVNSINMKRIFKIGWKALGDFRKINKAL